MELEASNGLAADDSGSKTLQSENKIHAAPNGSEQGVDRARSAEHIRELNVIDHDVTKSLQAAGGAIKSLTNSAPASADDGESSSLDAYKNAFEEQTNTYYRLVQSVAARLRRQIYALEEAGIIAPNQASMEQQAAPPAPSKPAANNVRATAARTGTTAAAMQQQRVEPPMEITNGGLGNLDVGWLNSRSDRVGKQMEAELWAQARAELEKLQRENSNGDATANPEDDANDNMEIDET